MKNCFSDCKGKNIEDCNKDKSCKVINKKEGKKYCKLDHHFYLNENCEKKQKYKTQEPSSLKHFNEIKTFKPFTKNNNEIEILDLAAYDLPTSLANRDICLENIEAQIERKKKMLLEKKKVLNEAIQQNSYLKNVKNDYLIYYNYIIKKKEQELEALQKLNNYTQELIMNTDSTEEEIKKIKKEQDGILLEMKNIKKSLQEVIGNPENPAS
jgi:hypothetical protein